MAVPAYFSTKVLCASLCYFVIMSVPTKSCYICSDDPKLSPIYLPDRTPVFVGRNQTTQITDTKCSRQQVWLCANYADQNVLVKQLGSFSSGCNGFKTHKNVKFIAKHGDRLEILYNHYPYTIEFNPPPEQKLTGSSTKKRSHESNLERADITTDESLERKKFRSDQSNEREKLDTSDDQPNDSSDKPNKVQQKETIDKTTQNFNFNHASNPTVNAIWEDVDNKALLIYTSKGVVARSKIAAYDMDGTLIKTKSGLVFPKDHNDWQIIFPEVPGKLKKLFSEGYKVVIFTNQAALGTAKTPIAEFKIKIERVVEKIGVPIQVFIAAGRSKYRKPVTGMWEALVNHKNEGVSVSREFSFFVGDAAGRKKDWAPKKKKDHSSADRLLALNLNLKFQTPEEHFLGQKPIPYEVSVFDPKPVLESVNLTDPFDAQLQIKRQEVVILVGCPGSGKSHFAQTHFPKYEWINRDTLGSWQNCCTKLDSTLSQGRNAIVDNTNPDPATRQRYIEIAKQYKVPVRCFMTTTTPAHTKHNNKFRQLTDPTHVPVSDIIINSYIDTNSRFAWRCIRFLKLLLLLTIYVYTYVLTMNQSYRKNYKLPTLDEGYTEIVKINFVPKFDSKEDERLYRMYLLEK